MKRIVVVSLAGGAFLTLAVAAPLGAAPLTETAPVTQPVESYTAVDVTRDDYTVEFDYWYDDEYPAPAPADFPAPVYGPDGLYEIDDPNIHPWNPDTILIYRMPRAVYPGE